MALMVAERAYRWRTYPGMAQAVYEVVVCFLPYTQCVFPVEYLENKTKQKE